MIRGLLVLSLLLLPVAVMAGQKIVGANHYHVNEKRWPTGEDSGFWTQGNYGTFEVTEGPLESGWVECHGAGFWDGMKVTGGGICVYVTDGGSHTWKYTANPLRATTWEIVYGTGKYEGINGSGKSATRIDNDHLKIRTRITDWIGEVDVPKR